MSRVTLGDVAVERRESCKGDKSRYPVVGLEHLTPEEITLTAWDEAGENTFTKIFYKGDVLFGRRRAYLKKAALAPFEGICSGDITVIKAKSDYILHELLPFVIQNDNFFDFAVGKSAGSLSPRVKWEHLKEYEFTLPSLKKQESISKILWSVNDTIEAYRKLTTLTDELVKAKFIEMFGDPRHNTKHMTMKKLSDVCIVERGGSPRPIAKFITESENGINWIKIGDADETRYISKTAEKIILEGAKKSRMVYAGDLILSNSMSFGHPYILKIKGCIHDGWLVFHFDHKIFNALYLQVYLSLPMVYAIFESMAAGGVVNNLNSEIVKKLPVLVPKIEQQEQFANFVQQIDKSKSEIKQAMTAAKAMMKKIIAENLG